MKTLNEVRGAVLPSLHIRNFHNKNVLCLTLWEQNQKPKDASLSHRPGQHGAGRGAAARSPGHASGRWTSPLLCSLTSPTPSWPGRGDMRVSP